jgi:hypothetical protein
MTRATACASKPEHPDALKSKATETTDGERSDIDAEPAFHRRLHHDWRSVVVGSRGCDDSLVVSGVIVVQNPQCGAVSLLRHRRW